ncbi:MAG: DUF427 domain-containing protein [Pseudomonadota bacterium]
MADHIKITKAAGTWSIRAGGAVIGESANALELAEGTYTPVIYVPRADIAMAFLEKSARVTTCPHKGAATHYTIVTKSRRIPDAAWSYETPKEGVARIAGHLAFYTGTDEVTLEQI